jgi:hypothetical protein
VGSGKKVSFSFPIDFLGLCEEFVDRKTLNRKIFSRFFGLNYLPRTKIKKDREILCQDLKGCYIAAVLGGG